MSVSNFTNKMALQVGGYNGLNVALSGMAAGAGVGAVGGIFSDHDTILSGAIKGGMIGLPLGAGVKYVGSRYSKGFIEQNGMNLATDIRAGKASAPWNTDYFTKTNFEQGQSFMGRWGL